MSNNRYLAMISLFRFRMLAFPGRSFHTYRSAVIISLFVIAFFMLVNTAWADSSAKRAATTPGLCRTNWLYQGQIGLSTTFVPVKLDDKEELISRFQVRTVADQAVEAGASWFLITLHHQPWIMSAPNKHYDHIMGTSDYTTQRDLPLDLQQQLEARGIKMMLYVNLRLDPKSACPAQVRAAMGGWPPNDKLIDNMAAIYREYSLRYGKKVVGWWVDGAYLPEYRSSPKRESWFKTIANALRAGNPNALVAFNPGLVKLDPSSRVARYSRSDDFAAGESADIDPLPVSRWVDGVQWHLWTFLGGWWGSGGTRYSDRELGEYVSLVTLRGGALTFDVGTLGVDIESRFGRRVATPYLGYIDPRQIQQIKSIRKYLNPIKSSSIANCIN